MLQGVPLGFHCLSPCLQIHYGGLVCGTSFSHTISSHLEHQIASPNTAAVHYSGYEISETLSCTACVVANFVMFHADQQAFQDLHLLQAAAAQEYQQIPFAFCICSLGMLVLIFIPSIWGKNVTLTSCRVWLSASLSNASFCFSTSASAAFHCRGSPMRLSGLPAATRRAGINLKQDQNSHQCSRILVHVQHIWPILGKPCTECLYVGLMCCRDGCCITTPAAAVQLQMRMPGVGGTQMFPPSQVSASMIQWLSLCLRLSGCRLHSNILA